MSNSLVGKNALITGAARGQGRACALRFVEEGASVALCDLDSAGLEETRRLIHDKGGRCYIATVDLRDLPAIEAFVQETAAELGGIDIIYNNAGISISKSIEDHDEDLWDLIQDVNVKSQFFLIKYALPYLRASTGASIINVSSMAGVFGQRNMAAYCTSKGAVNMLTKALAVELVDEDIRVNGIAPGLIETEMVTDAIKDFSPEEQKEIISGWATRQLMKRAADPSEVANVAVFLASDESSFLTGEVMNVSGGWAAV